MSLISLYKLFPISPFLIIENNKVSDWPFTPVSCFQQIQDSSVEKATCNLSGFEKNIILIGDSHAQQLFFGLNEIVNTSNNKFNSILLISELMRGNWRINSTDLQNKIFFIKEKLNQASENDIVIFSITSGHLEDSLYGVILDKERLVKSLNSLLKDIFGNDKNNYKLILMLDTPHLKTDVARICSKDKIMVNKICDISYEEYLLQNKPLVDSYNFLIDGDFKTNNIAIFDPTNIFCNKKDNECSLYLDNEFILIDGNHINIKTSNVITEQLYKNEVK